MSDYLDGIFFNHEAHLLTLASESDTDGFFTKWSHLFEDAVISYVGLNESESKVYKQHGQVHFATRQAKGSPAVDKTRITHLSKILIV